MILRNLGNNKVLALVCIALVLLTLAGCGGSEGPASISEPARTVCDAVSVLNNGVCETFATMAAERMLTPFTENGAPVSLEVVLFKPLEEGRYPTMVFHHGSTGNGSDPSLFTETFFSKTVAYYFVSRGWMVVFPQRRGRGLSDGLYDEGFKPDRSGYSCVEALSLAGAMRALDDLDAITDWLLQRADVDTTRMLVGGTSRGGVLAVAHVAERPAVYRAAINFVGGWIAEGCGDFVSINRSLFVDAARFPGTSLWLYGENDSFYSLPFSRGNFDAFTLAGGMGTMVALDPGTGRNGHFIINDLSLWETVVEAFLEQVLMP